ncbi:ankyrin repeat domain-containing protein [uncultured Bacteroides sp.]|uniref:ankyrin repeat domain-containing protein n=1 Tax=uncultured Bacteroides sp. TaxID=162156 RepID=UPI0025D7254C|nr:ankyrin repeat domain-containing protein [uncultured Bacteroides sp.]
MKTRKDIDRTKFLIGFVCILFLFPVFICAKQQPSSVLPKKYTELRAGDISSIRQMLEEGISVNAVDEKGHSLLMLAAYKGDIKTVKFLIEAGADINQLNRKPGLCFANTPLEYALRGKQKKMVDYLLFLSTDDNAKSDKMITAIYACGLQSNYEMLKYLLDKGVVLSDEDKINTMILSVSSAFIKVSDETQKTIMLLLQDMVVDADDLRKSRLLRQNDKRGWNEEKINQILTIQESYQNKIKKQKAEQKSQDSLRHLLESRQTDTHSKSSVMSTEEKWTRIERVDYIKNEQGNKSAVVSWILLGLTILTVYYCCQQMVTHVYKERPDYLFPYIVTYLLGGWALYSIFSCVYRNLDDIIVRKQGEEKIAVLDLVSIPQQYEHRKQYHTYYEMHRYFVFTGNDSIRIAVNQGNTRFDADDYTEDELKHIKVRYDSSLRKLAVDNEKYFMQNLIWISFMGLLVLVYLLFCWGVFNGVLDAIQRKLFKPAVKDKRVLEDVEEDEEETPFEIQIERMQIFGESVAVDTYWTLSDKEYFSMKEFIQDVQHSEELHDSLPDERINPERVLFNHPYVHISLSPLDGCLYGEEDINLYFTSDNGFSFTEGELLFKVHHAMIPYLDRLKERTLAAVLGIGYKKESNVVKCLLMFQSEVEDEDYEEDE